MPLYSWFDLKSEGFPAQLELVAGALEEPSSFCTGHVGGSEVGRRQWLASLLLSKACPEINVSNPEYLSNLKYDCE